MRNLLHLQKISPQLFDVCLVEFEAFVKGLKLDGTI